MANLGDSGLMIMREGARIFRTKEQQHEFDLPYQLGTDAKVSAKDATFEQVLIKKGDIVIVASDGLWDNLSVSQTLNSQ